MRQELHETGFCNFLYQKLQNRNALAVLFLIEIKHFYQKVVLNYNDEIAGLSRVFRQNRNILRATTGRPYEQIRKSIAR